MRTQRTPEAAGPDARWLLETARAEIRSGSLERAWQACLEAAEVARRNADAELLAEAATLVAEPLPWRMTAERQALCLEALGMLGVPSPEGMEPAGLAGWRERVRLHLEALSTGWADRVLPAPRDDDGDARDRFAVLQAAALKAIGPHALAEGLALAEDGIRLGRESGDDEILAWGWLWRLDVLACLGIRTEFDGALSELTAAAGRIPSRVWMWRLASIRACIALMEDRLDEVPLLAARALHLGKQAGADAGMFDLILRGVLARRTGKGLEGIEIEVRHMTAGAPFFAQSWRAEMLLSLGRREEAAAIWYGIRERLADLPFDIHEWLVARAAFAELAIAASDREGAAQVMEMLAPYANLQVSGGAMAPYGGPVTLALARLSSFLGDQEAAARWAADALSRAQTMRAPWFIAQAQGLLGTPNRLETLSRRETEIARLVARGTTNREIGLALVLSERTVEQHVRNTLRKLGLPNRAALAGWVVARD